MPDVVLDVVSRQSFNVGKRAGVREGRQLNDPTAIETRIAELKVEIGEAGGFATGPLDTTQELIVTGLVWIFLGPAEAGIFGASTSVARQTRAFFQGEQAGLEQALADLVEQGIATGATGPDSGASAQVANQPKVDPLGSGFTAE